MTTFESVHQNELLGKLTTFDRMIFKGHLTGLYGLRKTSGRPPRHRFQCFLSSQGVLLKDFAPYVEKTSRGMKQHAEEIARREGRQFIYLESAHTHASPRSKETMAREIAEKEKIETGLVCVFSVLEPCSTFTVRGNHETQRLEVAMRRTKCLHFYFYLLDPEFGWMHVRVQSWFPFTIQVYINGREWLGRRLVERRIEFERHDNSFTQIGNLAAAQRLGDRFVRLRWPDLLDRLARRFNPILSTVGGAGFRGYYWVLDQCEIATDVMFRERAALVRRMPDFFEHAVFSLSAEDIMRFLGRKFHGNFQGEVITDHKRRPEGRRVKHRMKGNSIKIYDKHSILRVETTINEPGEFKVYRPEKKEWCPMGKGVGNLWRYRQVGEQANERYLEVLAQAEQKGEAVEMLDRLCRSASSNGKRVAAFQLLSKADLSLFAAVLSGDHLIRGFRNRDLQRKIHSTPPPGPAEYKRRCARISRLIAKLRGHGLIAKVRGSRLYHLTLRGYQILSAILRFCRIDFPRLAMHPV